MINNNCPCEDYSELDSDEEYYSDSK
jgi:hypothetical protein